MFDDDDAVAGIDQAVQDVDEFFHVLHVQADGGFVEHVEGVRGFAAPAGEVVAHFAQFSDELDALGFAAAQGGAGLAEGEVAQAHVAQQLQRVADGGHAGEEFDGFVHFHLQHFADVFAAPGDGQGFGRKARAVAGFAGHFHVGQEGHFDGAHALAFAGGAAAFAGVEGKAPGAPAARARFQGVGKEFAHAVPKADVGGGARARGFADGGLIDFEHAVDAAKAFEVGAARGAACATVLIAAGA